VFSDLYSTNKFISELYTEVGSRFEARPYITPIWIQTAHENISTPRGRRGWTVGYMWFMLAT